MKTLLILRHGKSSWKDGSLADHDRPLKKRGKRDANRIGTLIRMEGIIPDTILCSSAVRAKRTALIVAESCGFDGEIILDRSLYHGYSSDFIEILNALEGQDDIVMIVGHNPGLEEFLSYLVDGYEWLPTAALAQVVLDIDNWAELREDIQSELLNIWRPRELR